MAGSAVIGALRVNLGIDTAVFEQGLAGARKSLACVGKQMQQVGIAMSAAITAPLAGIGVSIVRTAGAFEASMNRVQAATGASAAQFQALREQAKELGRTTAFSASEAADAQETLAKNGVNVADMLNGVTAAALNLAAASGTDLPNAADIANDVMLQFGKRAEDMAGVTDQITGVLLASKFGIDDYRLALAQAGGVAGGLGVKFEDFNAAIAATSSLFASGSDAGTAFKTFVTRLTPQSDKAAGVISKLGLEFYDAQGNLKDMAAVSEELRTGFAGLSEEMRTSDLTTLFGQDSMRIAIGLMKAGREGIEQYREAVARGNAEEQAAARMKGWEGAVKRLRSAFEALQIAIGDSGLLDIVTRLAERLTDFVARLSEANPALLRWGTIIAAVAAILGPVVLAVGGLALALSAISLPAVAAIGAFAGLGAAFLAFGDRIVGWGKRVWSTISNTLGPPLIGLIESAKGALASVADLFASLTGLELGDGVGSALSAIKDFLAGAAEFAGTQVLNNLSAGLQGLAMGFNAVNGAAAALKQLFQADFAGAVETVKATLEQLKTDFTGIMQTMFGEAVQKALTFVNDITATFQMLPEKMEGIGRDIVQGLIDGITSMEPGLFTRVMGIGARIKQSIRGALDIQSPSRDMHEIGVYIMEGLQNGMLSMQGGVVSVAAQTAEQVRAAVAMAGAGSADPWTAFKESTDEAKANLQEFGSIGQSIGGIISGAFKGVINGSKSVGDALKEVGQRLADLFLDQAFKMLFSPQGLGGLFGGGGLIGGGGSGLFGGLFGGIGSWFKGLFGFASGGSFTVGGGSNKMDSNLVAFRASAGETVDIHRGDRGGEGTAGAPSSITVNVEGANGDGHVIKLVRQGVEMGLKQFERQQLRGGKFLGRIRMAQATAG